MKKSKLQSIIRTVLLKREVIIIKTKKLSIMILILSLVFFFVSGCSTENQAPTQPNVVDDSVTGIKGTIKTYNEKNNSIVVDGKEERTGKTHFYDRAQVSITDITKVYLGEGEEEIAANELKEGMNVEIIFYGPIVNTLPIQAKAKTIRVFETE